MKTASKRALPVIAEDGALPPASQLTKPPHVVPKGPHATFTSPLRHVQREGDASPPSYSFTSSSDVVHVKFAQFREHKRIAKRGGWKRLAIVIIVILLCLVGLIIGLVVGLRNRSGKSSSSGATTPSTTANNTFPSGSYAIDTFLTDQSTDCTSNPATWRCYPYVTYSSQSPSSAAARFDWIIQPQSEGSNNYIVSASDNPFSFTFKDTPLELVDAGQSNERYTFQIVVSQRIVPVIDISGSNLASSCYYNSTTLQAELYTSMAGNYTSNNGSMANGTQFVPWPYASNINLLADSGSNVPQCLTDAGAQVGDFSVEGSAQCICTYRNFGT